MDAMDTVEIERPSRPAVGLRRVRRPTPAAPVRSAAAAVAMAEVSRLTWQLPVVVSRRWSTPLPLGKADAALRLQAALWELAARRHVRVGPGATTGDVARLLAEHRALTPGAARAAAILDDLLADDGYDVDVWRLTGRLIGHLELRARFG